MLKLLSFCLPSKSFGSGEERQKMLGQTVERAGLGLRTVSDWECFTKEILELVSGWVEVTRLLGTKESPERRGSKHHDWEPAKTRYLGKARGFMCPGRQWELRLVIYFGTPPIEMKRGWSRCYPTEFCKHTLELVDFLKRSQLGRTHLVHDQKSFFTLLPPECLRNVFSKWKLIKDQSKDIIITKVNLLEQLKVVPLFFPTSLWVSLGHVSAAVQPGSHVWLVWVGCKGTWHCTVGSEWMGFTCTMYWQNHSETLGVGLICFMNADLKHEHSDSF